jgi:beta-glucosidase
MAGLELEMPGPSPHRTQALIEAVQQGELDESVLNVAVERLLKIILKAQETPKGNQPLNVEGNHALARRVASECIVLLKNKDDLLPLKGTEHVAVIGQAATTPVYQGGGSSHINSTVVDAALPFLQQAGEVQYIVGDASVEVDSVAIAECVQIAESADVAVLFIALPASIESEGYDRPHLSLTPQQVALIQAVARTHTRTVVVLNNGSALDMREWIDEVDAVLEAWLPGQAGAGAISDILYGKVNPSAKVGETFPLKLQDIPAQLNFPGEGNEVRYGEGLYVGYRAFEAMGQAVLFPFGFGLSYTQFAYSDLQVSATAFGIEDALEVSLNVTNVGAVAGQEVVQVYVHDVASKLKRPYKELKAFTKVSLAPQETKRVTLTLNDRAFSYYHPAYGQWIAEAGAFDILVGSSSADIHLSQQVELTQGTRLPSLLNEDSLLSEWMEDPQGAALVQPLLDSTFKDVNEDDLGVNMVDFFKDLPLKTLLGFNGASLEQSPDVIVRDLLSKITA